MVIYRHKDKYSISEMCQFFKVSRSGYYGYVSRMDIPAWDLPLAEKIREEQLLRKLQIETEVKTLEMQKNQQNTHKKANYLAYKLINITFKYIE